MNPLHKDILDLIKARSGTPTRHTFNDGYLGNAHPRYPINAPSLRLIARSWMKEHAELDAAGFSVLLTSLIEGASSTEKCMAGILLDASRKEQRQFPPQLFDRWLDHLVGWAEVDSVCTGAYTVMEIPSQWKAWKKILTAFSKSKDIHRRRASLVLLCSPLRRSRDERLLEMVLMNSKRLGKERDILITKAISWALRSAAVHHKGEIKNFVALNKSSLPAIAVRETMTLIKTGTKTKRKK